MERDRDLGRVHCRLLDLAAYAVCSLSDQIRALIDRSGIRHQQHAVAAGITPRSLTRFLQGKECLASGALDGIARMLNLEVRQVQPPNAPSRPWGRRPKRPARVVALQPAAESEAAPPDPSLVERAAADCANFTYHEELYSPLGVYPLEKGVFGLTRDLLVYYQKFTDSPATVLRDDETNRIRQRLEELQIQIVACAKYPPLSADEYALAMLLDLGSPLGDGTEFYPRAAQVLTIVQEEAEITSRTRRGQRGS